MRIPISEPTFLGHEVDYVREVMKSRQLSCGPFVKKFEQSLGEAHGGEAIVVSSGTAALHVTLLALGLLPGQRVVVPSCSYIATANAVTYCGAVPVFVDVTSDSWMLDPWRTAEAVRDHDAVGVITVHLYGERCGVPNLPAGRWVVEDACEAHGLGLSRHAAASVLSFYGNKIISCGEGGAVITRDAELAHKIKILRGQGTTGAQRYVHEHVGFNYRMTDVQAAIGYGQSEQLQSHLIKRAILRKEYDRLLQGIVTQTRSATAVDWVMPVICQQRDHVAMKLADAGIETRPVFPPLHLQPPYRQPSARCVHAEWLGRNGLLLPLHLGMDVQDVRDVCEAFLYWNKEAA